ncbi:hypothetical protein NDU88_004876 [Pleurodeles waltl]|uniref:Uncharacterized protein n=1 Tax=Pleurodeles waltl TaxID=8319 RepID=A0AAV7MVV4_PLEWA|nr:hypothetical protein NDU88_004876 [Pleurodeles waltl]
MPRGSGAGHQEIGFHRGEPCPVKQAGADSYHTKPASVASLGQKMKQTQITHSCCKRLGVIVSNASGMYREFTGLVLLMRYGVLHQQSCLECCITVRYVRYLYYPAQQRATVISEVIMSYLDRLFKQE